MLPALGFPELGFDSVVLGFVELGFVELGLVELGLVELGLVEVLAPLEAAMELPVIRTSCPTWSASFEVSPWSWNVRPD